MMKRLIAMLLLTALCLSAFSGCEGIPEQLKFLFSEEETTGENPEHMETGYKLEIVDADHYPIQNTLKNRYEAGEDVTIQLETAKEYYYVLTVNGVEQNVDFFSDSSTYYTFLMPNEDVIIRIEEQEAKIPDRPTKEESTAGDGSVRFMRVLHDYYVSGKTIPSGEVANAIVDALENATKTGETVDWISDQIVESGDYDRVLPVETYTVWIEAGGKIYRMNSGWTQIACVESHLGAGYVVELSQESRQLISGALYYYPYNYYLGYYYRDVGEFEVKNVYKGESTIELRVLDFEVNPDVVPQNKLTIELTSTVDQTLSFHLTCAQSDDNLYGFVNTTVHLKANQPQRVELMCKGFCKYGYFFETIIDNTFLTFYIWEGRRS